MTRHGEDVWVTGIGAVTSLGMSAGETWSAMLTGTNGITAIDAPGSPVRIAAMFPHDPAAMMERTHARRLDRSEQAAVVTARQASSGFCHRFAPGTQISRRRSASRGVPPKPIDK